MGLSKVFVFIFFDVWLFYFNDLFCGVDDVVCEGGWLFFFSDSVCDVVCEE